ncbi:MULTISPECIES: hypothetical protein [unclassified Acinetobacter]|uniref:hypothetical protein n=1 Tax=unclassified Acinetobacter TaxID=196816 RepID=UPI0035B6AF1F
MKKIAFSVFIATLILTGCATTSAVKPNYVSPTLYQDSNCQKLYAEYQRLDGYIEATSKSTRRSPIGVGTGLGIGFGSGGAWGLYPSISINMTPNMSSNQDAELADLYGQKIAITQAAHLKQCVNFKDIDQVAKP